MYLKNNRPYYLKEDAFLDLAKNSIEGSPLVSQSGLRLDGQVAIIEVEGPLFERSQYFRTYSGIINDIRIALNNPQISTIILNISSPGGDCYGTEELASYIYHNKSIKPIIACINNCAASSAYYVASSCTRIFNASSVSESGSIGVVELHYDTSIQEKNDGIIVTEVYIGKYKRIASYHKPLTDEGRQYIEDRLVKIYGVFVRDVALYRNKDIQYVLEIMADGKEFFGEEAIVAGLVDEVATLEELICRYKGENEMNIFTKAKAEEPIKPQQEEPKNVPPKEEPLTRASLKQLLKEVLMEIMPPVKEEEPIPTPKAEEPPANTTPPQTQEEPAKEPMAQKLVKETVIPRKMGTQENKFSAMDSFILKKVTSSINPRIKE